VPIIWAVTKLGKRIPLDPPEIRASEHGPGREVVLVVDGAVRGRLREDPAGDVVGREAHWATCPNADQHRRESFVTASEQSARFRARRAVLEPIELAIPPAVRARLLWIEDGTEEPACGWVVLEAALVEALERWLMARAEQIRAEGLASVKLGVWKWEDIEAAWKTAQARLELTEGECPSPTQ
jgi:hypothetical protein